MGKRGRRRFGAAEKVAILKRHLVEKEETSRICKDLKTHPNQLYEWQKVFFDNGVNKLNSDEQRVEAELCDRVSTPEEKL
jgi:transposase